MKIFVDSPKCIFGSMPYLNLTSSDNVTLTLRSLIELLEKRGEKDIRIRVEGEPSAAESRRR